MSLQVPCILFRGLKNPFESFSGIKADELIANTELSIFNTMRCRFGDDWSNDNAYEEKEPYKTNGCIEITAIAKKDQDTQQVSEMIESRSDSPSDEEIEVDTIQKLLSPEKRTKRVVTWKSSNKELDFEK